MVFAILIKISTAANIKSVQFNLIVLNSIITHTKSSIEEAHFLLLLKANKTLEPFGKKCFVTTNIC